MSSARQDAATAPPAPRVCLTCRHLQIVEQGQAVPGLIDSTFTRFRCLRFGTETTEMTHFPVLRDEAREIPTQDPGLDCPGWELWTPAERPATTTSP